MRDRARSARVRRPGRTPIAGLGASLPAGFEARTVEFEAVARSHDPGRLISGAEGARGEAVLGVQDGLSRRQVGLEGAAFVVLVALLVKGPVEVGLELARLFAV